MEDHTSDMYIDYSVSILNQETLEKSAIEVVKSAKPKWDLSKVCIHHYSEGLTNKLIGFYYENFNNQILVRVAGKGTELFIDRNAELETVKLLHTHGIGPKLHAVFKNGFCYGFTPGKTTTNKCLAKEKVYPKIAKLMATMHRIEIEDRTPKLFHLIRNLINLIPSDFIEKQRERQDAHFFCKQFLNREADSLEIFIEEMESEIVFSHNDLMINNILINEENKSIHFIDYEYASANYLYYEIGNHFCEFAGLENVDYTLYPNADFARKFLRYYLSTFRKVSQNEVSDSDLENAIVKTNVMALASHLLWGVWSIVQASLSTIDWDYSGYANIRLSEYERRKEEFISAYQNINSIL